MRQILGIQRFKSQHQLLKNLKSFRYQNGTWDIIFASQSLPEELCSSIIYLKTLIHDMNFCSITTQVFLLYYDSGNFHSLLKKIDPSQPHYRFFLLASTVRRHGCEMISFLRCRLKVSSLNQYYCVVILGNTIQSNSAPLHQQRNGHKLAIKGT